MSSQIIVLQDWLQTPPGQVLLDWENQQLALAVSDVFGYHALQLGLPTVAALQANRMPHQWVAATASSASSVSIAATTASATCANADTSAQNVQLITDLEALPFSEASLDLVVMPHSLEFSADPHQSLREAARVLVPEGRIVVTGFNPASLWGFKQWRNNRLQGLSLGSPYLPQSGELIAPRRLRDWLRLLGFEVESLRYGIYQPSMRSEPGLKRMNWLNALGRRYWPFFGAAYCMSAVKRVRGIRPLGAAWKAELPRVGAPVPLASRATQATPASPMPQAKS
jgi:SAM-dependent methyltransferase